MSARVARQRGAEIVIGVDLVPERLEMAGRHGVDDGGGGGRGRCRGGAPGADRRPWAGLGHRRRGHGGARFPRRGADAEGDRAAPGSRRRRARPSVRESIGWPPSAPPSTPCRRGGTISVSGVYGGQADTLPMMDLFDKGVTAADGPGSRETLDRRHPAASVSTRIRSARATWRRTRCRSTTPHEGYEMFQKKQDGCIKILLTP